MNVSDLIKKLKKLNQNQEIYCHCEDEGLRTDKGLIQYFDILEITEIQAKPIRLENGIAGLKFDNNSTSYLLIGITSDI